MKKIISVTFLIIFSLGSAAFVFGGGDQEEPQQTQQSVKSETGYTIVESGNIKSGCKIEGDRLSISLSAPTEGWISIGFKPTAMMKDANIIIGYVEGGDLVVEDHFGVGNIAHQADTALGGTEDILPVEWSESDGTTSFSFSIPLDSGDEFDQPLKMGETVKIILAYGSKDNFNMKHGYRSSVTVTIE